MKNKLKTKLKFISLLLLFSGLNACTTVQPWEKNILARPEMALNDKPIQAAYDDHIYFSKEGASGGRGFSGGGCGCN